MLPLLLASQSTFILWSNKANLLCEQHTLVSFEYQMDAGRGKHRSGISSKGTGWTDFNSQFWRPLNFPHQKIEAQEVKPRVGHGRYVLLYHLDMEHIAFWTYSVIYSVIFFSSTASHFYPRWTCQPFLLRWEELTSGSHVTIWGVKWH